MAKAQVHIGEVTIPTALNTQILSRAFKDKELLSIWEAYEAAKYRTGRIGPPTDLQVKVATARQEGYSTSEIMSKFKVKNHQVYSATTRVAIYNFLNKK